MIGANSQDNCCQKKIVKGVSYKLVEHSGLNPDPSCINSCIYQEEFNPSSHFCFKEGDHQAECVASYKEGKSNYLTMKRKFKITFLKFIFPNIQQLTKSIKILFLLFPCADTPLKQQWKRKHLYHKFIENSAKISSKQMFNT